MASVLVPAADDLGACAGVLYGVVDVTFFYKSKTAALSLASKAYKAAFHSHPYLASLLTQSLTQSKISTTAFSMSETAQNEVGGDGAKEDEKRHKPRQNADCDGIFCRARACPLCSCLVCMSPRGKGHTTLTGWKLLHRTF